MPTIRSHPARPVFLLVATGMVSAAVCLGAVGVALRKVASARLDRDAASSLEDRLTEALDRDLRERAGRTMEASYGAPAIPGGGTTAVRAVLEEAAGLPGQPEVRALVLRIRASLQAADGVEADLHSLGAMQADQQNKLAMASGATDAAILSLRECADGAGGHQRIREAILSARFRARDARPTTDELATLIESHEVTHQLHNLTVEVLELALISEKLCGATELDELASIKDNRFLASLSRLRRMAQAIEADAPGTGAALAAAEASLLGADMLIDSDHQTIVEAPDGLFSCKRALLALQLDGRRLRDHHSGLLNDVRRLGVAAGQALAAGNHATARRSDETLRRTWLLMGAVALASMGAFVFLGLRVARATSRQLAQVRAANESLALNERALHGANEELRTAAARLEAQAADLRAHGTELETARAEADAANRAKSEFLANMSHEIRTPMGAIIGYADLLIDPAQPAEERAQCIQVIRRNGEHLLGLINDILDISKIEAGRMTVEEIETSPVQLAEEVVSLLHMRAAGKGITLRLEHALPLPRFSSDPLRVRQVLMNIVGNAIKFTDTGGVVLRTSMDVDPAPDGRRLLRFQITDTGIGMSPEQLARLFRPFTQADTSMTRRFGGTGLGLMISQRLMGMLGGDIRISSEAGKGTAVTLTLAVRPTGELIESAIAPAPAGPPVSPPAAGATVQKAAPPLQGRRILLAEDGPDNQRLISFHLRRAGADVTIAENGRHAVDAALRSLLDGAPFGLVLMDMQMPELDGYSATGLLRKKGWTRPIVALTAHAMSGDRERCLRAGCDDYMTKPVDKQALLAMCARWLAVERPAAAA